MSESFGFAAEIIKRSAAGYAGAAASLLLEREEQLRSQSGALEAWKAHLTQRLLELSSALGSGQDRLFSERVVWSRKTFAARDQEDRLIGLSLSCLDEVLGDALPQKAAEPVARFLEAAINELQQPVPLADPSELSPDDDNGRLALNYLRDVLEGNGSSAIQLVVEAVEQGLAVEDAYLGVLLPAQKEIGRLWHANEVSVAEEHLVSMITQKTMAVLAYTSERAADNGATVITACVAGNAHDMGPRALADLYHLAGWRSIFLGADVPVSDLPAMLDAYDARVISLTATLSTHLEPAATAIAAIREHCESPVRILVGGALFDEAPEVATEIGADAYTGDMQEALAVSAAYLD